MWYNSTNYMYFKEDNMVFQNIKKIVVAGAGTMGSSMAQSFAENGYEVTIYNRSIEGIERCKNVIELNRQTLIKNGVFTTEENEKIIGLISYSTDKDVFKSADLAVESIAEDMGVKQTFWQEIGTIAKPDAILSTNTSGLSISKIAEVVANPERFAGFHWVNPPHIIPIIEVIKGEKTSAETAVAIKLFAEKIGKETIEVKDVPGFCFNRFQFAILREAMYMVEEGIVTKEDVDKVFKYGLGIRYAALGPFEIADLGGLDVFYKIIEYLFADLADNKEPSKLIKECYESGRFGVKNQKGFYDYEEGRDKEVIKNRDEKLLKIVECLYKDK